MGNTSSIELPVALVHHTNQQLPISIESGLVVLVFNSYNPYISYFKVATLNASGMEEDELDDDDY